MIGATVGQLFAKMFLAAIGAGWFAYNAQKLGQWLKDGRAKAPARFWIMVPYRTGCMILGLLWMSYILIAGIPGTDTVRGGNAPKSAVVR